MTIATKNNTRIVVKIGSSLLVDDQNFTLAEAFIDGVMADIKRLRNRGYEVVVVSSGAVALGLKKVNRTVQNASLQDKQAAAAFGQPVLLNTYKAIGQKYACDLAQILVTLHDIEDRESFLNAKNTINKLLENQIIPIVNENDTVATEELRVGDNDRLAAMLVHMVQADYLVILTNVDGLYDRAPDKQGAQHIPILDDVSEYLAVAQGKSDLGSGGMLTKLQAAHIAQNSGCITCIGRGEYQQPISSIINSERKHTRCIAKGTPESAWQSWLINRLHVAGSIFINNDAAQAIAKDTTAILYQDVVSSHGEFKKGAVLHVYDDAKQEIARGLSALSSAELSILLANPGQSIAALLGYQTKSVLIHEENLAVLQQHHILWDAPKGQPCLGVGIR